MIINEHVKDYISSLETDSSDALLRLEKEAAAAHVPIIRRDSQSLLRFLMKTRKPEHILEIGTAVGFSTLYMYEYAPETAQITTVEKVEMRLREARKNLAGYSRIKLIEGDAAKGLKELEPGYDFIFLDAAKGQYMTFLPDILRILTPGGMLVTDNVLQEGSLAESKFTVTRRDRTIHMRMREYLHAIMHSEELDTVILPVGDGMSFSVKKQSFMNGGAHV